MHYDILTYNKKLQNNLFLNIDSYKNISQKYQKIENNNEVKQYILSTDILIKELEYETFKNKIIGKEYDGYGNLKFYGEYINKRKISGEGYDNRGNIILILKNGKGEEYPILSFYTPSLMIISFFFIGCKLDDFLRQFYQSIFVEEWNKNLMYKLYQIDY